MVKKRAVKLLFLAIGIFVLVIASSIALWNWLNRPLPVSLKSPESQPIKDVIAKSHEIEYTIACNPESNLNLLEEVYIDTDDYRPSKVDKLYIAKYLGSQTVSQAGYLTYKKAYFLWSRSGDSYPGISTEIAPDNGTKIAPTPKPSRYCPDSYPQPEILYGNIAIRDNKAIVKYDSVGTLKEAILKRVNDTWFIVSVRVMQITF